MATVLRTWSFRYPWLYDLISGATTLLVGGEQRFRRLPLQGLTVTPGTHALDLCCGSGLSSAVLAEQGYRVTGLDCSPIGLAAARQRLPNGEFVQGRAERLPFAVDSFDLVHTSLALHEMTPAQIQTIFREVQRVLVPGGIFTFVDFQRPHNPLLWPGLALFLYLFETRTAWQLLDLDLPGLLAGAGFTVQAQYSYVGGSIQVMQAHT